ncbi:16S rRNA (guanine(527)-N(7))-methyltransferase RsmG [Lactonifactor longoviformis]|uniref:Ribosomal RNA small subunit methyltransferase G n=1 Tax=Lactonifactor longoviformis DSM 17459 TaxID=1122155 RepID=A0A1M4X6T2_9CLOT|nr:16S rRNA (guanine(527)-N(7))-methyltransferase RsmG [Lactonifactor longoviformis]POP32127.1 16S rRNA (guanine(527)-N(7))-methyltransferase RsmG [Lactonifactor longoviformis]SHE89083.1 16S rRNA (guanine527-N7)-methyltransferase [Lactonifactor longoviformis DSM 17459]
MNYNLSILEQCCKEFHLELSERQKQQFIQYYELLAEWNKVMNLTGITQWEEVLLKHFADSLSVTRVIDLSQAGSLIDVGTGAGFPGIPIKIAFPHIKVTLLDSLNKRINFLNEVIGQLGLEGITAVHGRAEDIARKPEHRDSYDVSVSRAVANLASLTEYCMPFVKPGGCFISYKSGTIEEELVQAQKAIKTLGGRQDPPATFSLMNSGITRSLIKIIKQTPTPRKYPRKAGLPTREPIM